MKKLFGEEVRYLTADEIFDAAGRGDELLNLKPPEDALYSRARLIYYQFRHGELKAEDGAERRRLAILQYKKAKETENFQTRQVTHSAKLFKDVETAARDYRENPGRDTADALLYSIYQVQTKVTESDAERWEKPACDSLSDDIWTKKDMPVVAIHVR